MAIKPKAFMAENLIFEVAVSNCCARQHSEPTISWRKISVKEIVNARDRGTLLVTEGASLWYNSGMGVHGDVQN